MAGRDRDNVGRKDQSRWPTEAVWSTLLVLALGAGVVIWAYTAPKPISPSYRASENPSPAMGP